MSALEISETGYLAEPAGTLVRAALADLMVRYGNPSGDDTPVDPAQFDPPDGAFLVAWLDGVAVGCGGWRSLDGGDEVAEIKRMYVAPAARGRGVAMAILRALEDSARRAGRKRVALETGTLQPEAIALYRKAGYLPIEHFGYYKDEPGVCSFGREL